MAGLSREQVRRFYDWLGARQDTQAFYEDAPLSDLVVHSAFEKARSVFEFGCGTGRFAARLLANVLRPDCVYHGIDISPRMVALAQRRLEPWRDRAGVKLSAGGMHLTCPDAGFDRFVATYVFDLLAVEDIRVLLAEARRVLAPAGLVCLVSLTLGATRVARILTRLWQTTYRSAPRLVGGCRPIELHDGLLRDDWNIRHRNVVTAFGVSSEVVVAARR
jgi:ubiquinone/menaquinone biosynthesis C-methylase UbiE